MYVRAVMAGARNNNLVEPEWIQDCLNTCMRLECGGLLPTCWSLYQPVCKSLRSLPRIMISSVLHLFTVWRTTNGDGGGGGGGGYI